MKLKTFAALAAAGGLAATIAIAIAGPSLVDRTHSVPSASAEPVRHVKESRRVFDERRRQYLLRFYGSEAYAAHAWD